MRDISHAFLAGNGDSLEISTTFLLFKDLRTGGTATVVTSTGSTEKEFAMPGV